VVIDEFPVPDFRAAKTCGARDSSNSLVGSQPFVEGGGEERAEDARARSCAKSVRWGRQVPCPQIRPTLGEQSPLLPRGRRERKGKEDQRFAVAYDPRLHLSGPGHPVGSTEALVTTTSLRPAHAESPRRGRERREEGKREISDRLCFLACAGIVKKKCLRGRRCDDYYQVLPLFRRGRTKEERKEVMPDYSI